MKLVFRTLFFFALIVPLAATAQQEAKVQKIGYVNVNELLQSMARVQTVKDDLEKHGTQLETQITNMAGELDRKVEAYYNEVNTMSDAVRKDKEREITQLRERIERFQQEAQDDLTAREKSLLEPILKDVREAIKKVATDNGYTYVIDTSSGLMLFNDESYNLMALVKAQLGD
ncbi:MAG: OmpH family outer membrane protein [Bacteroidia bacterium]